MKIELALLISVVSVGFSIYTGISSVKRGQKLDMKKDANELTTVIVKLESIGTGVAEIKAEMNGFRDDVKELRERIVRVEESSKQAHKRIDTIEERKD